MRKSVMVGAVATAIVGATTWALIAGQSQNREAAEAESADALVRVQDERDALASKLESAERTARRVERERVAARAAAAAAETAAAAAAAAREAAQSELPSPASIDVGASAEDWRKRVAEYPAFAVEGSTDGGLGDVDWVEIGENMSAIPPLVRVITEHLVAGRPLEKLPPETIGSVQRHSASVLTAGLTFLAKGTPGTGVTGAVSHPTVMANLIGASLEAIGMPLDAAQSRRVRELTVRSTRRDEDRRAALADDASEVIKLVGQSEVRHDYLVAVFDVLTDEQHAALRPEIIRGRLRLDLYCARVLWIGRAAPLVVTDRADFETRYLAYLLPRVTVPAELHERVGAIVHEWSLDIPDEQFERPTDAFVTNGNLHVDDVVASARETARLVDLLLAEPGIDDALAARLRALPGSLVWFRSKEGGE